MGSIIFVLPLLPYTAPPTVAATSPREQNTDARPNANDNVGRSIFLSFLSPAAVDIYLIIVVVVQFYSTIKGRRQTHFLSFPCININQIKSNITYDIVNGNSPHTHGLKATRMKRCLK